MPARLIESLATTDRLADLFSDNSVLQAMLDFEVALAAAEAAAAIIPRAASEAIAKAASGNAFDHAALARDTLRAGTPGIPLVKVLTERVRSADSTAAGFVHWGATSQDVADTALILLLKRAQPIIDADLSRLEQALERLSGQHKSTVMLGRTLLQPAPPITFGLKAAGWFAAVHRAHENLTRSFRAALILQFGGASGTLASLGSKGIEIGSDLAKRLGLEYPDAPWHTFRDRLAALVSACGVLTAVLGKIARDVSLMMQYEVAEAAEKGGEGRGGSSTMPHKRNPIGCAVTLGAAQRLPGLVATFLGETIQEQERGVGGWQAEWQTVSSVVQSTGLAADSMAEVAEGLTIDAGRMRANIDSTGGLIFAERAMMLLAPKIGRDKAHNLLEEASRRSLEQKRRLSEVLREMPEVTAQLGSEFLDRLDAPEDYLGSAEAFRTRLLASSRQRMPAVSKD